MAQAGSILSLLLGAALFGAATRLALPPAAWIGLAALVHASRSMPAVSGATCIWVLLCHRRPPEEQREGREVPSNVGESERVGYTHPR
jgi:hypothetical protein